MRSSVLSVLSKIPSLTICEIFIHFDNTSKEKISTISYGKCHTNKQLSSPESLGAFGVAVYKLLAVEIQQRFLLAVLRMDLWILFMMFCLIHGLTVNRLFCLFVYKRHSEIGTNV